MLVCYICSSTDSSSGVPMFGRLIERNYRIEAQSHAQATHSAKYISQTLRNNSGLCNNQKGHLHRTASENYYIKHFLKTKLVYLY
jgi:hypothetical protein